MRLRWRLNIFEECGSCYPWGIIGLHMVPSWKEAFTNVLEALFIHAGELIEIDMEEVVPQAILVIHVAQ